MANEDNQQSPAPFENLDIPRKGELSVGEVLKYRDNVKREAISKASVWTNQDVRGAMETGNDFEKLSLRGPIQVAGGKNLLIAVHLELANALSSMFDVHFYTTGGGGKLYASVQKTGSEKAEIVEAELRYVGTLQPETQNHIVISQGLARRLEVDTQTDIKINKVYQKAEDLNLDDL